MYDTYKLLGGLERVSNFFVVDIAQSAAHNIFAAAVNILCQ